MADSSAAPPGPPGSDWFAQIAGLGGLIFFIMRIRPDIAFEYISSAVEPRLGIPVNTALADPETVLGRIEPGSRDRFIASLAMEPGEQRSMDLSWRHVDGRLVDSRAWMRASGRPDGSVVQEGVVLDSTELRAAEAELRRSEQRSRLLAENAYDVIWTMALDGSITYVSSAVERVLGFTPEEADGQTLDQLHTPQSAARVATYFQAVFAAAESGGAAPVFRGEVDYHRKDGSVVTGELQLIPHVDTDGQVVELLGVTRDISERKRLEADLNRLAATDHVTGVWNRHRGAEALAAETAGRSRRSPVSVLMVDIDNFKSINDSHGHQMGDLVLSHVATRLGEAVRNDDIVARWGGDEFVVILRNCTLADAAARADKVRSRIADADFAGARAVTVSIGVAEQMAGEDHDSWMGRADRALYEAKRSGRDTVAVDQPAAFSQPSTRS